MNGPLTREETENLIAENSGRLEALRNTVQAFNAQTTIDEVQSAIDIARAFRSEFMTLYNRALEQHLPGDRANVNFQRLSQLSTIGEEINRILINVLGRRSELMDHTQAGGRRRSRRVKRRNRSSKRRHRY